jgi:hypothetical protein
MMMIVVMDGVYVEPPEGAGATMAQAMLLLLMLLG